MELILAIAVLAALVWAAVFVLRGSLMAGCLVFLVVNACFGFYFFHVRAGPLELTLDRVMLLILAALWVVHWRRGDLARPPLTRMDYAIWGLLAWLAVRTFTSDFRNAPDGQSSPLWHLIVGYGSPLFLYWTVRQSPLNERTTLIVQKFFIAFGIYLAVTGCAEVTGQWWAVFPRHIADPDVGLHFGRARGPMVQAIVYGFILSISLATLLTTRLRWQRRGQVLLLAFVPLLLAGIFFSYTRCVWMSAVLAVAIVVGLTLSWRHRAVAVACLCLALLFAGGTQWERLHSFDGGRSADASRDSASMRVSFTYVSWRMFKDRPLLGCGFGQYMREKDAYLADRSTSLALEHIRDEVHHNLFLSILVETGLVGLVLYLVVLGSWAAAAWRLWRGAQAPQWARSHGLIMLATLGAYLPNALFQPMGHMNIAHMVFFFLAGISSGLQVHVRPAPRRATRWFPPAPQATLAAQS